MTVSRNSAKLLHFNICFIYMNFQFLTYYLLNFYSQLSAFQ
jgi:hypothetical protein